MTKQQTIFRAVHSERPYFLMLRTTAQDSNLSFEARGLIAYLLSKPNDWEINKADLMREGDLGRTKMKRILDELTEAKYMTITQEHDEDGLFTKVVYTLHEEPLTQNVQPVRDRLHENRERIEPQADNDHQHNTESLQSTEQPIVSDDMVEPEKPSKPERDALFDALAWYVFGAKKGTPPYKAAGGRVGKLQRWCFGGDLIVGRGEDKRTIPGCTLKVTPDHIIRWVSDWKSKGRATVPRSPEKFVEHFYPWLEKEHKQIRETACSMTTSSQATREALLGRAS